MGDETPKRKEPTASEAMFFYAIVKHTRNKADIDWAAVAEEQNFKNAEVAKVRFGQVKRKLGIDASTTPKKGSGSSGPGATPTKVVKTPSGRVGSKGKARGRVKKEEHKHDDDDDDDDVPASSSPIKGEKSGQYKAEADSAMNDEDPF